MLNEAGKRGSYSFVGARYAARISHTRHNLLFFHSVGQTTQCPQPRFTPGVLRVPEVVPVGSPRRATRLRESSFQALPQPKQDWRGYASLQTALLAGQERRRGQALQRTIAEPAPEPAVVDETVTGDGVPEDEKTETSHMETEDGRRPNCRRRLKRRQSTFVLPVLSEVLDEPSMAPC